MARLKKNEIPSLRRHSSGQGIVVLSGETHYLGVWPENLRKPPPAVQRKYDAVVAEWIAGGRQPLAREAGTINDLVVAWFAHAQQHYRGPDGQPTSELSEYRLSLRPLVELFGDEPIAEFSPRKLKACRDRFLGSRNCRSVVNRRTARIVRVFRWGVAEELVPNEIYQSLSTVGGLQKNRSEARESEPVEPVSEGDLAAVLAVLSPRVAAMVRVQLLTGMRPAEVCSLCVADIDTSGRVWIYTPGQHKTAYRGRDRKIWIGPRAQEVLQTWLRDSGYLFRPDEEREEYDAARSAARTTPGVKKYRRKAGRQRSPGLRYSTHSYNRAIARACEKAGVERWGPNRLRHNFATEVRAQYGLDAAQVMLGHARCDVTQVYAAVQEDLAQRVAGEAG